MKKAWIILAVLVLFALISTVSAQEIKFDTACDVSVKYLGAMQVLTIILVGYQVYTT